MALTDNRGPDSCIDAMGCEASGHGATDAVGDKVKATVYLAICKDQTYPLLPITLKVD